MNHGYPKKMADGGYVKAKPANRPSPKSTDDLCRQSASFKPNDPTYMSGPGVRSMQDYKK
jgi:hypothetical protein